MTYSRTMTILKSIGTIQQIYHYW